MSTYALALIAAAALPSQSPPPGVDPAKWPYYAKVEIVAQLKSTHEKWEPMYLILPVGKKPIQLPVDASKVADWTAEQLLKANGKTVRAKARVELQKFGVGPDKVEEGNVYSLRSLEVIDSKTEEDRKKVPPFGASIEMAGTLQDLDYKRGFLAVAIPSRPSMYGFPMDINKFSAWASKDWREALGGAVRLTGSLESRAIPVSENREEDRVTIVLKTIEVFNDDLPPRKR